ncbi:uncharacterized protein LOC129593935 [Paramacrobiotus metropolitanus]|uniref:uncharacterized protein LOC129593935 n=1 Tax=Paramacrobiotus metropolitanus TaxID=2943436 RepID=UPI00244569A2|nr:uncharacterized protein LOC129593935 [Paramacrobiotus metropolitanus]
MIIADNMQRGAAIQCYECNSAYDPRCGDHFDNLTYPLTDCRYKYKGHLQLYGATKCRKMIVQVHNHRRIIRECAFLGQVGYNDGRWCLERVGARYVSYSVCLCDNKDGCNSSGLNSQNIFNVILFISVFL